MGGVAAAFRLWPILLAFSVLSILIGKAAAASALHTSGRLIFTLDDPYIHMAMAKNFALHGVWGVTRYGFTSSTSSPLWTFILSVCYRAFGVHEIAPFVLNFVSGMMAICFIYAELRRNGTSSVKTAALLVLVVLLSPLPWLIMTGMEHTLQALLTIAFASAISVTLTAQDLVQYRRSFQASCALACLLAAVRYEGLFAVAAACTLLGARARWWDAAKLGLSGLGLVAVYGAVSMAKGAYWLPNSVLLKGSGYGHATPTAAISLLKDAYEHLLLSPHILLFVLLALVSWWISLREPSPAARRGTALCGLFLVTVLLHMAFVPYFDDLWSLRYDAYLVPLGVLAIAPARWRSATGVFGAIASQLKMSRFSVALLSGAYGCLVISVFVIAANRIVVWPLHVIPQASTNIYQQQYQMGRLLRQLPAGTVVGLNDIGAANFLADIRCVDFVGLASMSVARARRGGHYGPDELLRICDQESVAIAVVYDSWFKVDHNRRFKFQLRSRPVAGYSEGAPRDWYRIGQWQIRNNIICGDDIVSFYSVTPTERPVLMEAMRNFAADLPRLVAQSGRYMQRRQMRGKDGSDLSRVTSAPMNTHNEVRR